jgi:hypothetical protein
MDLSLSALQISPLLLALLALFKGACCPISSAFLVSTYMRLMLLEWARWGQLGGLETVWPGRCQQEQRQ